MVSRLKGQLNSKSVFNGPQMRPLISKVMKPINALKELQRWKTDLLLDVNGWDLFTKRRENFRNQY